MNGIIIGFFILMFNVGMLFSLWQYVDRNDVDYLNKPHLAMKLLCTVAMFGSWLGYKVSDGVIADAWVMAIVFFSVTGFKLLEDGFKQKYTAITNA